MRKENVNATIRSHGSFLSLGRLE